MSLRIGIVGCGAVTRIYYAEALLALAREEETLEVALLFDPDAGALQQLAGRFPEAKAVSSWEDFTAAVPDIAIVASPPQHHAQQCVALIEADVAVLCEKPLALHTAEADRIAAAAARPGAILAVGMLRRYLPAARTIAWLIQSGAMGQVQRVRWLEGNRFRWPIESLAYFRPEVGGVLADIGIHVMDLLQWWLGDLSLQSYEDDNAGGVEANCLIRLRDRKQADIAVRLTRDDDPPVLCRIDCERGAILWRDGHPTEFELRLDDSHPGVQGLQPCGGFFAAANAEVWSFERAFVAQLQDLIAARRQGRSPAVTAASARAAVALLEACYATRKSLPLPWAARERLAARTAPS